MANSKQRGRPKTGKGNRVRVSIMLDPDLVDWSRSKRSDMVNRLLRLFKGINESIDDAIINGLPTTEVLKGVVPSFASGGTVKPGMIEHIGPDKPEYILPDELLAKLKGPKVEISGEQILKLINRAPKPPKDKP